MGALRVVLGDQLTPGVGALAGLDPVQDRVLMVEVEDEQRYVPHHRQKIVLVLAAMRHFAAELATAGVTVDYVRLDDPMNTGCFRGEVARAVARHRPERVVVMEPGEFRVADDIAGWGAAIGVPVEVARDPRFLCSRADFAAWAAGRRQLRMEFFYREMRRRTGLLMDGPEPVGGAWNLDAENRKRLEPGVCPPPPWTPPADPVTAEVLALVAARYPDRFGDLDGFAYATRRADAEAAFGHFLEHGLARFGDYQDAMTGRHDTLFHSVVSPYLNIGLLDPLAVCRAVEAAWRAGAAPLNAAEGYIRQIIGWREYVRGIYWLKMPAYARSNHLGADRPLPGFYWTGETDMACMAAAIGQTRRRAYAHHIQRLMVTGNFALLAGVAPAEIHEWYLAVYADAFEWVELPNTLGMAMHADGGYLGSKPYAASGAYIDRMSDHCGDCRHDVKLKAGSDACPFNYLYWDFIMRHESRLRANPRMAMPYRTLDRMAPARRAEIARDAAAFLDRVVPR